MGLYDDRLADLSESRRGRISRRINPAPIINRPTEAKRKPTKVQSLLFSRNAGWTPSKAKAWAKSHGYKYGKVHVTDQQIRIRQFSPKGFETHRTIPFGSKGIRAVVVREETAGRKTMARSVQARRKRRKSSAPKRRRRSSAKKRVTRRRRRTVKVEARRTRRARRTGMVMQARRRRKRRVTREAWKRDAEGHSRAARKGWRRKKAKKATRRRRRRTRETVMEAPRRRRRRRVAAPAVAAPRRRRRRRASEAPVMEASRRRRRRYVRAGGPGMDGAELALGVLFGGIGFAAADALDRFLATYNPSDAERPKDKFVSEGNGQLANTLNISTRPGLIRLGSGIGAAAVPAIGSMYVRNSMLRSSLQGVAIGAGVNLFKTVWNNFLMPMLIGKDTSTPVLQKSVIARLYPSEVAAAINMRAVDEAKKNKQTPNMAVNAGNSGLSGAPRDVGPFALSGDPNYPDAGAALRRAAGVGGDSPYPDTGAALRRAAGVGGDPNYPDTNQALRAAAGVSAWEPGPATDTGPGPKRDEECGSCLGRYSFAGLSDYGGGESN